MLLSLLLAASAFAASPNDFVGEYQLIETRAGMCYDRTAIEELDLNQAAPLDLDFGSGFRFLSIDAGPQEINDDLVHTSWNARMTATGVLVEDATLVTKPSRTTSRSHSEARLSGSTLHLTSTTTESDADGSFSFRTECVYRKVK